MKKILCSILTLILVFTSLFAFSTTAYAADKTICNDSDSVNDNDYCYYCTTDFYFCQHFFIVFFLFYHIRQINT